MSLSILFSLVSIPLLLAIGVASPNVSLGLLVICVIIVYSSVRLARNAAYREPRIVATTFWIFVYVFLGLAPFLQLLKGHFPAPGVYLDSVSTVAALLVLLGMLAFDAGYVTCRPSRNGALKKILTRPLNKSIIPIVAFATLILSALLLLSTHLVESLFVPRAVRSTLLHAQLDGSAQIRLVLKLAKTPSVAITAAMAIVGIYRKKRQLPIGMGWKILFFVMVLATLILNNPLSTARLMVGSILLAAFLMFWKKPSVNKATIIVLVFGIVFVFPVASVFRTSLNVNVSARIADFSPTQSMVQSSDFDSFQMIQNGLIVVDRSGYRYGAQLVGALLFWVPRKLWPGKPVGTGHWIAEKLGFYQNTNRSAPLWVEFFVDGGWLWLIIGMVLYGKLVRRLDRGYAVAALYGTPQLVSILVPLFAGYQIYFLRGSLMGGISSFSPILLFAVLCTIRFRKRCYLRSMSRRPQERILTDTQIDIRK